MRRGRRLAARARRSRRRCDAGRHRVVRTARRDSGVYVVGAGGCCVRARRLGQPAPPCARRPDLRGRAQVLEPAHGRAAVARPDADAERLVLPPVLVPVHLLRVDGVRAPRRGRERADHAARRRTVPDRRRRQRIRALRVVLGPAAARTSGGGLPARAADGIRRRARAFATTRSRSSAAPSASTGRDR